MMLMGLMSPLAFAQSGFDYELDESRPLITDVNQLSSPWNAPHDWEGDLNHLIDQDPDTYWHSNWNNNSSRQYFQVALQEPVYELISFQFQRRWHKYNSQEECVADHVIKWGIYGCNQPDADEADWVKLAESETPYARPAEILNTAGFDTQGFQYLRFYAEQTNSGYRWFHLAEAQLYPCTLADELTAALRKLEETYYAYADYLDPFYENVGILPGQYSEEAVAAFDAALDQAVKAVDSAGASYTADDVDALANAIKDAYEAVLASEVPFTLADGYYRIRHSCTFINNIDTGDKDDDGTPITEEAEVYKYIYAALEGEKISALWNTPAANGQACPYLWKVTNKDGFFDIVNCATDARFNEVPHDSYVTLSTDATNLIAADLVHNVDGDAHVTLRVSTQVGTDHTFLHPLSHGIQAGSGLGYGTQGYVIGWANDKYGVSEWVFEPVDDDQAAAIIEAYEPYKNRAVMVEQFKIMREDVKEKMAIAKDLSVEYDAGKPYITEVDQLSSPWNAPHDWEGNLAHLIDNDPLTYWHTNWNNNSNWQYVQVALSEPAHELTAMHVIRRKYKYNSTTDLSTSDHVTIWGILGSDYPDAEDADWVELATIATPYQGPGEELTACFDPQGKQYLRIYAKETNSGKRYWHCAELQLYPGQIVDPETSQYHMMGDVAEAMDAIYEEMKDIDANEVTVEQYEAFKNAYEAFIEAFVDPSVLREQIAASKGADNIVVIGTDPGFWSDNTVSDNLAQAIADAEAYDEAGIYTKEATDTHIAALKAAVDAIPAAANPIKEGKWYRIRFGTEEEYDQYKWNKNGNETQYRTYTPEGAEEPEITAVLNEANFGKYLTVARTRVVQDEDPNGTFSYNVVEPLDLDEVAIDDQLYSDDLHDLKDPDLALFRFVLIGDSAYALQNKATGLFLQKRPESNDGIYLTPHPSFFTQKIAGYGQNALFIKTLSNENQNPLHFARNRNVIITYGNYGDSDGRRGCFFIEEVEDVEPDYATYNAPFRFMEGSLNPRCYPATITFTDDNDGAAWSVAAIERNSDTEVSVTLGRIDNNVVPAGFPFIYIASGEYYEDEDPVIISATFKPDFVAIPQRSGALCGVFSRTTIGVGALSVGPTTIQRTGSSSDYVNSNRAYIAEDESFKLGTEVTIVYDEDGTGINEALQRVARTDVIYNLNGQPVARGNINTMPQLKQGIYILNGLKVVVK